MLMFLSIYYQNVRGMKTKTLDIYNTVLVNNYDIICLTETWLDDTIMSSELFDERYCVIRRDRDVKFRVRYKKSHGGGVLVAYSKNLTVAFREDWVSEGLEDLWLQIKINESLTISLCVAYLPEYLPTLVVNEFVKKCSNNFNTTCRHLTCIVGDFNLGDIVWSSATGCPQGYNCEKSRAIYDLFHSHPIQQLNNHTNHNNRILDLVITDGPDLLTVTPAIPMGRLDIHHPPFEIIFRTRMSTLLQNLSMKKLCYRKTDFDSCTREMEQIDWDENAVKMNCDEFVHFFTIIFT